MSHIRSSSDTRGNIDELEMIMMYTSGSLVSAVGSLVAPDPTRPILVRSGDAEVTLAPEQAQIYVAGYTEAIRQVALAMQRQVASLSVTDLIRFKQSKELKK